MSGLAYAASVISARDEPKSSIRVGKYRPVSELRFDSLISLPGYSSFPNRSN